MALPRLALAFSSPQQTAPSSPAIPAAGVKAPGSAAQLVVVPRSVDQTSARDPEGESWTAAVARAAVPATAVAVALGLSRSARQRRRSAVAVTPRRATSTAKNERRGSPLQRPCLTVDYEWSVQTEEPVAPDGKSLREWRLESEEKVKAIGGWPAPENDRLLKAARGEPVDRPPKWLMRQAGRYLPEYMETLKPTDFFTVCKTPALACEVTLQPIRRYPTLDSMIIFSDILVVPVAMGMNCRMEPAVGPQFDFRLESPEDFKKLDFTPDVKESLAYVFDAIFWTRQRSGNKIPVIGFSGAPWTLMGYMVEGGAVRSFDRAKKWLYHHPEESKKLLTALRDIVIEYLVCQFDAGAPLLTIFDTNCGEIPPKVYEEFMVDDLKYIATEIKRLRPKALLSVFPKDGEIATFNDSDFDVVGCSWTASPAEARAACPDKCLQGNLDPYLLYADPEQIATRTRAMVEEFGVDKYIANLGHGMLPTHPVTGPKAFIDAVDTCTKESIPSPAVASAAPAAPAAPAAVASAAPAPSGPALTLHLTEDTSVSVPMTRAGAEMVLKDLAGFRATFKEKMDAKKPKRWDDFDHKSSHGDSTIEVYCNLNAFATIFDVRMFLTVKCGTQIKVSSEVQLSTLQSDLEAFLAA